MTIEVSLETAMSSLDELLKQMKMGETATLTGPEGQPIAILVSLNPAGKKAVRTAQWSSKMEALAEKVSKAWIDDKTALETLSEMRR